jgi:L-iditol 2-dehydrogenase
VKAWFYYGPGDIRFEDVPAPDDIGPGDVLVKVDVALTCGTDLKTFRRGHPHFVPPTRFGHEFCGTVVKVGQEVDTLQEGQRVVALPLAWCGKCYYCQMDLPSQCTNKTRMMGAYGEYLRIPAATVRNAVRVVPEGMPPEVAALVEPLSVALHGVDASMVKLGDSVAINGAGPIGLLLALLSARSGARVIVCDPIEERLEAARRMGLHETIRVQENVSQVEAVKECTPGGRGVDIAIEAVGRPGTWERTVQMVRPGGTAVLFGGCKPGTSFSIGTEWLHYGEVCVRGVYYCHPWHFSRAFELLARGVIPAEEFVTDEMPLERLIDALEKVERREAVKVALKPQ